MKEGQGVKLTGYQRNLARHALGLPNDNRRSYRNRYASATCGVAFEAWEAMVTDGHASAYDRSPTMIHYELTHTGALAALDDGETLCPEDFPPAALEQPQ